MNIDKLILKEQKKRTKTNTFSMDMLLEMVEDILEVDLKSKAHRQLLVEASGQTMTFQMIPDINVSELGWARGKTPEGAGYPIGSGARQQLEQYLEHIEGNNFPEKLASLQAFYTEDAASGPKLSELGIVSGGESSGQQVQKILGYLVFYKTLTTIVTNFNASSAGFSFEAFLGVLLGGSQVPTGGGTIADLKDESGQYISLKLYTKGGVEVGGSFHDLVGDLVDHPMHYIVGMKKFSGQGLDANGQITFWGFTFTRDNVMDILRHTKASSSEALQLPLEPGEDGKLKLIDANSATPNQKPPTIEDYDEALKNKIQSKEFWEEVGVDVSDVERKKLGANDASGKFLFSIANPDLFGGGDKPKVTQAGIEVQLRKVLRLPLRPYDADQPDTEEETAEKARVKAIKKAIHGSAENLYQIAAEVREVRAKALGKLGFADTETSVEYYNSLKGQPELQNQALRNTRGFLQNKHFSIPEGKIKKMDTISADSIPKNQPKGPFIGALDVGSQNVENMLNLCKDLINQSVFDIFKDVKELTTKVNQFFASGMMDTDAASEADVAAKAIESETKTGLMGGGKKGDGGAELWPQQSAGGDTAQPGGGLGEQKENKKDEVVID